MDKTGLILRAAKAVETALAHILGATGRGLHEKLDSVGSLFSVREMQTLRVVATLRNKLVHEVAFNAEDMPSHFIELCDEMIRMIESKVRSSMAAIGGLETVEQFAQELGLTANHLIEQLKLAGVTKASPQGVITEADKELLLVYLREVHGHQAP